MLCRKAGVPKQDARGRITSHRARSTIASQLYNAKEPLSLFELQEWLGHASPESTQYNAKITPTKLAKSYARAGYCTYDFFEQCLHRMACAMCSFYVPKESSRAQLLEVKSNLQQLLQEIPVRDEERAAAEGGFAAVEKLYEKLADVPTPAGLTPREMADGRWLELPILPAVKRGARTQKK